VAVRLGYGREGAGCGHPIVMYGLHLDPSDICKSGVPGSEKESSSVKFWG
jgi:hypothetical protein